MIQRPHVAFILPSFPSLTGTFYVNEIIEVGKWMPVSVFSIWRGTQGQDGMDALVDTVRYLEGDAVPLSDVLRSHVSTALRHPAGYIRALWRAWRGREFGMLKRFRRLPLWAEECRTSGVTHLHGHFADFATEAAMLLSMMSGLPFSFTAHAYDIYLQPRMMPDKIGAARFVITCTEYNRRHILNQNWRGEPEKIIRIYHGIYVDTFVPPPTPRPDGLHVLCVGRMVEKKGMDYLVRACALLRDRRVSFDLVLVGDGPERESLARLVDSMGLAAEVRFTGALRRDALLDLYHESTCFCLPSFQTDSGDRDGIPNVLAEAMATELPVVSTDVSGIPELLEDGVTGLQVPQKSVEAIADALSKLAGDADLRTRLGRSARRRIVEVFDVTRTGQMLAGLFQRGRVTP